MDRYETEAACLDSCDQDEVLDKVKQALQTAEDVEVRQQIKTSWARLIDGIEVGATPSTGGTRVTLEQVRQLSVQIVPVIAGDRLIALGQSHLLTPVTTGPSLWGAFRGRFDRATATTP